jgi:HPt (histidine-containing phosphotransfer) domain-containing protein
LIRIIRLLQGKADRGAMTRAIDLQHLELYICGDVALRDEILTIFDEQASLWLAKLDPSEDDDAWRDAAHALKGAARGVGAWEVGDLCEDAEDLVGGAPEKTAKRQALLERIAAGLDEAVSEARQLRDMAPARRSCA